MNHDAEIFAKVDNIYKLRSVITTRTTRKIAQWSQDGVAFLE